MRVNFWLLSLNNFTLRWTHISNRVVSTHIEFCLLSFSQEPTLPARTYPSKRSSQTYTSVAERFSMMQRHKKKSGGFRSGGYGGGMAGHLWPENGCWIKHNLAWDVKGWGVLWNCNHTHSRILWTGAGGGTQKEREAFFNNNSARDFNETIRYHMWSD
jgi:hypothetical protein